jgi:transposase
MKAYTVELRERIVEFVGRGGTKVDAAAHFKVGRRTVYRYLDAAQRGNLSPKPQPGRRKKFTSERLRQEVRRRPDATLQEYGKTLGVTHNAVWKRLRQLALTLKKTPPIPRAR